MYILLINFMSSYFPIPNNFSISKLENIFVKCSVQLFNYPNNVTNNALNSSNKKKDIFFSLYELNNYRWIKRKDKKCEFGESCLFDREKLDIDPSHSALVIPSENKNNPNKINILPKPYSLRVDKSPINERASYNFKLKDVSSSYQGEFPYELSLSSKTFFSSDILRTDLDKDTKTYVILMNLNRSSKLKKIHELDIYSSKNGDLLKKFFVKTNSFNSFLLPKSNLNKQKDNLFLSCKTTSFIPIYINIKTSKTSFEISAEHTHPPHELFLGAERFKIASRLRNNWLF